MTVKILGLNTGAKSCEHPDLQSRHLATQPSQNGPDPATTRLDLLSAPFHDMKAEGFHLRI